MNSLWFLAFALSCADESAPASPEAPPSSPEALPSSPETSALETETQTPDEPSREFDMVFAGNFSDGGNCHKGDAQGCDLFHARFDLDHMALSDVEPLIRTPEVAEQFPVIDPESRYVLYLSGTGKDKELVATWEDPHCPTGCIETLVNRVDGPNLSPDGSLLAFRKLTKGGGDVFVQPIQLLEGSISLGESTQFSYSGMGSEPLLFPGNERLAYYEKRGEARNGATRIVRLPTGEQTTFSDRNGCAHGTLSYSGTRYFCQQGHKIHVRDLGSEGWSEVDVLGFPEVDLQNFPGCDALRFGHPEYCGDDQHVMVNISCVQERETVSSELVLFEWNGRDPGKPVYFFSREVAQALGSPHQQSRGVSCIEAPASVP